MYNNCETCKQQYQLIHANATVFFVKGMRFLDYVAMTCGKQHTEYMFFEDDDTRVRFVEAHKSLDTVIIEAEEWLIQVYEETHDAHVPRVRQLTPRHEALIAALGTSLAMSPDAALLDLFSQPPPHSDLPREW